jgi:hypothetical protein
MPGTVTWIAFQLRCAHPGTRTEQDTQVKNSGALRTAPATLLSLIATAASLHHSAALFYDLERRIEFSGTGSP